MQKATRWAVIHHNNVSTASKLDACKLLNGRGEKKKTGGAPFESARTSFEMKTSTVQGSIDHLRGRICDTSSGIYLFAVEFARSLHQRWLDEKVSFLIIWLFYFLRNRTFLSCDQVSSFIYVTISAFSIVCTFNMERIWILFKRKSFSFLTS